jgi:hypothetical protein
MQGDLKGSFSGKENEVDYDFFIIKGNILDQDYYAAYDIISP